MTEDKKFTERDLHIAGEMGALTRAVTNLCEKVEDIARTHEVNTKAMWDKIDSHSAHISDQAATIKWIIGIGIGIQAAWAAFVGFFKPH
jgi:hypothetical protein